MNSVIYYYQSYPFHTGNFTSSPAQGENLSNTKEFKVVQPQFNCENFSEGLLDKELFGAFDENNDVCSEYSSCSGGEEEGGVSRKDSGRELVRKERERIGDKNCKRRKGVGKKRKRQMKEQEFRQM